MKIKLNDTDRVTAINYTNQNKPSLFLLNTMKLNNMKYVLIAEENNYYIVALNLNARWKFIYTWISLVLTLSFYSIFLTLGQKNYLWAFIVTCFAVLCVLGFMLFRNQEKKKVIRYIENYNTK